MPGGVYTLEVTGLLNASAIEAKLAQIQSKINSGAVFGAGGKGKSRTPTLITNVGKTAETANKQVKNLNKGFLGTIGATKNAGLGILDVTKKVIAFGAVTSVVQLATAGIGNMVRNVFKLDEALTEYKKVSDLGVKGLEKMTAKAYTAGRTVAKTGTEMVQAATEFKKGGFTDKDAMRLGKVAMMYTNIADEELSAGDAANFIISQMKAYGMEAKDATHIIDAVNEVSNRFAVSSSDIATNIGKASAALSVGNVTYEQSIGLMTAMTEITRNGAKSARGLVSIQSRYNQIVDKGSSTGKKLTEWYAKHNIAIRDQNGQLRSFFEVGKDVSKIWDTLSDNEKKYYLNTQAGANQSQNLAALMQNYGTAIKATEIAQRSEGSAAKENEKYKKSLKGTLADLTSAWENFSRKLVDTGVVTGFLKSLTKVLDLLSTDAAQLAIKFTLWGTVGAAGIKVLLLSVGKLMSAVKWFKTVKNPFGFIPGVGGGKVSSPKLGKTKYQKTGGISPGYVSVGKKTAKAGTVATALGKAASILKVGGLVGGLAALTVAATKYIPIGEQLNKRIAETEYDKQARSASKLKEEYRGLKEELHDLEHKKSKRHLTDEEEQRLRVLKEQTTELRKQSQIASAAERKKFGKKEQSIDYKKDLYGTDAWKRQRQAAPTLSDKALAASLGVYTRLDAKVLKFKESTNGAVKAQKALNKALKSKDPEKIAKAQRDLTKANKDVSKTFKEIKKKQGEWLDEYGSVDKMPDVLRRSYTETKKLTDAYDTLSKTLKKGQIFIDTNGKLTKGMTGVFAKLGTVIGVTATKAGKLKSVNIGKFSQSIKNMGGTSKDAFKYLKAMQKSNPKMKFTLDGAKVALKDLKLVDGQIKKKRKVKVDVDKKAQKKIDSLSKKLKDGLKDKKVKVEAKAQGKKSLSKLKGAMAKVKGKIVTAKAKTDGKQNVEDLRKEVQKAKGKEIKVKAKTSGTGALTTLKNALSKLRSKAINITTNYRTTHGGGGKRKHKANGTRNFYAKGTGNAIVNEQGFEIIEDGRSGEMRVANGGKKGATTLNKGDAVYTHGQSMRMLEKAGISAGEFSQSGKEDFEVLGVRKLPGFKKGKSKISASKMRSSYDSSLETLEYQRDYYHWTDSKFAEEYTKIFNKYKKYLNTDQARSYYKEIQSISRDYVQKEIENDLSLFSNQKKTYSQMMAVVKDYYKKGKINSEEYTDYIKKIQEEQVNNTRTNYSNQWDYLSQYIQKQIDLQQKENDVIEAKAGLLQAQSQKVKVYKEGEGFVYTQDMNAVREAQNNLKSYTSVWEQLQGYMADIERETALKQAGVLAGKNLTGAVSKAGEDISLWKNLLSIVGGNMAAYNLAGSMGIVDPKNIIPATTVNGQTFNIGTVQLPDVTNANDFVSQLQNLAIQEISKRT